MKHFNKIYILKCDYNDDHIVFFYKNYNLISAEMKYFSKIVNVNNKKRFYFGKSKLKSENQQIFSKDNIVHIILKSLQHRNSLFDKLN